MKGLFIILLSVALPIACAQTAPQNAETTLDKGIENFHKGQYVEARADFERAVKLSPADARALTYLALTRAAMGDCATGIDELKFQVHRNPDAEIRRLVGLTVIRCLLPHNQFGEILPLLIGLRQQYPADPDVLYESAEVFSRGFSFSLYELQQKAPDSFRLHELSAEVRDSQGRYAEAAADYRKAIEKDPGALHLHARLGRVLMLSSSDPAATDEARKAFEAELQLNPSDAAAEYQLGQALIALKKPEDAAPHFDRALTLAPRFPEALVASARLKIDAAKYKEAIALLRNAIELQPDFKDAHATLLRAYQGAGKTKEAQREQAELDKLK